MGRKMQVLVNMEQIKQLRKQILKNSTQKRKEMKESECWRNYYQRKNIV